MEFMQEIVELKRLIKDRIKTIHGKYVCADITHRESTIAAAKRQSARRTMHSTSMRFAKGGSDRNNMRPKSTASVRDRRRRTEMHTGRSLASSFNLKEGDDSDEEAAFQKRLSYARDVIGPLEVCLETFDPVLITTIDRLKHDVGTISAADEERKTRSWEKRKKSSADIRAVSIDEEKEENSGDEDIKWAPASIQASPAACVNGKLATAAATTTLLSASAPPPRAAAAVKWTTRTAATMMKKTLFPYHPCRHFRHRRKWCNIFYTL